jgi:hypothetical protein
MVDKAKQPEDRPKKSSREERLAAALRENLRRRKAQARGRGGADRETTEPKSGQDG